MSIINEALQKIQHERKLKAVANNGQAIPKRLIHKKSVMSSVLFIVVIALICFFNSSTSTIVHKNSILGNKLELNGVFVSNDMKVAMINSQPYHIGDTLGDMKIVSIEHEGVKLKNDKSIKSLQLAA